MTRSSVAARAAKPETRSRKKAEARAMAVRLQQAEGCRAVSVIFYLPWKSGRCSSPLSAEAVKSLAFAKKPQTVRCRPFDSVTTRLTGCQRVVQIRRGTARCAEHARRDGADRGQPRGHPGGRPQRPD